MSEIRKDLLYTKEHEWLKKSGKANIVVVGITDFAQSALGDITYLQLPEVGRMLKKDEVFGSVESVKSVSDLFSPVNGKVVRINQTLVDNPAPINQSPYDQGWLLEIEISGDSELGHLLKPEAYEKVAQ
jgi:glycine cleavage system H protein